MSTFEKRGSNDKNDWRDLRRGLAFSTALASAAFVGYGTRGAHAGACLPSFGVFTCSAPANPATDVTQNLSGGPLSVTTVPGFGIDTSISGGNAFSLTGINGMTFTDLHSSAITGALGGINASNTGTGAMTLTTTGTVTAQTGYGFLATNAATGTDMTVSTAAVTGGLTGIFANNSGNGALAITATGDVTGTARRGITANQLGGTDLTISAGAVTGGQFGITANNSGSGDVIVTATGSVQATDFEGVIAFNSSFGGTGVTTVSVTDVTAGRTGVSAVHEGSGELTVTSTGTVTGNSGDGISARKQNFTLPSTTGVTVSANTVSGGQDGIDAKNFSAGALNVSATGTVTGGADGISATNNGTSLTVAAAEVSGGYAGISANNTGTGATNINATGTVTGITNNGIYVRNAASTTDLTVMATAVSGQKYGIDTRSEGTGAVSVTATGAVTAQDRYGILAENASSGTDLTVSATSASGKIGIFTRNYGSGALTVTATDMVTGTANRGIFANNVTGTDLSVSAAAVTGAFYGITATNSGTGDLSVTATGSVEGTSVDGIAASTSSFSGTGALTVSVSDVTGGRTGIYASHKGSGALAVTSTGIVTGGTGDGVFVNKQSFDLTSPAGVTVSVGTVTGGEDGIDARNYSAGALAVSATGTVTGNGPTRSGIFADNSGTSLTVSAADVSGGNFGIYTPNSGSGATTITATGSVTGTTGDGIRARSSTGTDMTLSVAAVSGGQDGIQTRNFGSGDTSITVKGAVTGGTGYGIATQTGAGNLTTIKLKSGASVSAASGNAISNDAGDSKTTVRAGASVTGAIRLGDGSDNLTFNGGNFSGVTVFDGGDDSSSADGFVDKLKFKNVSGSVAGASVVNWERVTVGFNGVISFNDNALTTERLKAVDNGRVSMLTSAAEAFQLTGDFKTEADGGLALDFVTDTSFDTFDVSGTANFNQGGEIDFVFDAGFNASDGLSLTFLTADELFGFDDLEFNFIGLDPLFTASVGFDALNDDLFITFNSAFAASSFSGSDLLLTSFDGGSFARVATVSREVPEPSTLVLFLAGLLGLFGLGRRRLRTA